MGYRRSLVRVSHPDMLPFADTPNLKSRHHLRPTVNKPLRRRSSPFTACSHVSGRCGNARRAAQSAPVPIVTTSFPHRRRWTYCWKEGFALVYALNCLGRVVGRLRGRP
jgi:hypothetical protein